MHKLAIFDIDGTLSDKEGIPQSVIDGLANLQKVGYFTTISTGRGYAKVKQKLHPNFEKVVSPGSLVIVEHGTKIVDRDGNIVEADYFQKNELKHIIDFIRANIAMVDHVRFWSNKPDQLMQVWCPWPEKVNEVAELLKLKEYDPEIFSCSDEELLERLLAALPTNISTKLKSYIIVENLKLHFTRSEIDTIFQDGLMEFVRNIADKGRAIQYLEKQHGIAEENMLVAGNAINDVDMLNLNAGTRILVGEEEQAQTVLGYINSPEQVVRVKTPAELGKYLNRLS